MVYKIIMGRSEKDKEKFGDKGSVSVGKQYIQMGKNVSLSNEVFLDVAKPHLIMVAGKRGCLDGATKIFTNHGYKDIKDFNSKKDKIYSFNTKNKSFEWEAAELLTYDINEEVFDIELQNGQSIIATVEHPFLVQDKNNFVWKPAKNITKEDKLVSVHEIPEVKNDKESVRIARILGAVLADGNLFMQKGRWKDGRGYMYNGTKKRIRIFNKDEEVLQQLKDDFEKEFNIEMKRYLKHDKSCFVLETKQSKVFDKINKLGVPIGNKSHIITVPEIVFESSNNFKANFLKTLFSCDGYISRNGRTINYTSSSKKFLEDLNLVLQHFDVHSVIRYKKAKCGDKYFNSYNMFITDHTSRQNFKRIGFLQNEKIKRLSLPETHHTVRRKLTGYLKNGIYYRQVNKISKINSVKKVYDLTVPKNHSFVANGAVVHNSGKSYTLGVIAEGISTMPKEVKENLTMLIMDTMGIYWTMKNANHREKALLEKWDMKPEGFDNVVLFVPKGKVEEYKENGMSVDKSFAIPVPSVSAAEWNMLFGFGQTDAMSIALERNIAILKEKGEDYGLDDIIESISKDQKVESLIRYGLENRFEAVKGWGLFDKVGTNLLELLEPGQVSVLDISVYTHLVGAFSLRALVIGLVGKMILEQRMKSRKIEELAEMHGTWLGMKKKKLPLVWIFIDEAHEFLPKDEVTPATGALIQIIREGRQPGLSMVLATQQPGKLHTDVLTQSDLILSHRVTSKLDVDALNSIMQTYLTFTIQKYLDMLPRLPGSAIVLDDNQERIYPIQIKPRKTWHGGEAPNAMKKKSN